MWSGATSYQALCLAAKSEEKRQAKLQKRRQYKPKTDQVQWSVNAKPFVPSERGNNWMGMTKKLPLQTRVVEKESQRNAGHVGKWGTCPESAGQQRLRVWDTLAIGCLVPE